MKTKTLFFAASLLAALLLSTVANAQVTKSQAQLALKAFRAKTLPASLSPAQKEALQGIVGLFRADKVTKANQQWKLFCESQLTKVTAAVVPQIESWVLNEAFVKPDDELEDLLEEWDEKLQSVGDDAQLANVDMQNMLQKQQQTIQMLSQISKVLHDTAMAVIRKMGG